MERRSSRSTETFDKNFPIKKQEKAWERAGESKEEFFKKRYAHVHAKQKENDSAERRSHYSEVRRSKKRDEYDDFKRSRRDHRRQYQSRDVYSTLTPNPLSEFVYGTSAVLAALKANKREFFNRLLIHNPDTKDKEIIQLATKMNVRIEAVDSRHELNILTNNGIHNGYVLETKPLQPTSVFQLGPVTGTDYTIDEDNYGDVLSQAYTTKNPNPLGIYVDGVTDPHNIGAIIRSAYFLGADFLVVSERNSASLSPVVTKTAVGATEFLPIMSATKPLAFFEKSKQNGWSFIAADSSPVHKDDKIERTLHEKTLQFSDLHGLLEKGPCVLVLGSEGEGIRTTLKVRSDFLVGIQSAEGVNPVIDSLNVSVAAALLIQQMLAK